MLQIKNRWRSVLDRKGVTQAQIAEMVGCSKPFMSHVANGLAVLPEEALDKVCATIGVEMEQIYPEDVLCGIYGKPAERKVRKEIISVKLRGETARMLTQLREAHGYKTNADCVKNALRRMREVDSQYGNR